jgi:hypothetical protein
MLNASSGAPLAVRGIRFSKGFRDVRVSPESGQAWGFGFRDDKADIMRPGRKITIVAGLVVLLIAFGARVQHLVRNGLAADRRFSDIV